LFTSIVTFFLFLFGVYYGAMLWIQTIPVAMTVLGALVLDRSRRGVAVVLGELMLLMYITHCLRRYGP
jgi:hypothetical protein